MTIYENLTVLDILNEVHKEGDPCALFNLSEAALSLPMSDDYLDFFDNLRKCTRYAAILGVSIPIDFVLIQREAKALIKKATAQPQQDFHK